MATLAPAVPKPRPYRRFLTSALHTRFVHAALASLLLSWDNATVLGPKSDLLWSWFPLGPAGLRALLFFIANLFIFFLQIATLNVGYPTSSSPASRLRFHAFSFATVHILVWHLVSACFFCEIYIFAGSAGMPWVTEGEVTGQVVLNERPIYLRSFYYLLAVLHAFRHIYYSHSTLHIPVAPAPNIQTTEIRTHPIDNRYMQVKKQMLPTLARCAALSVLASITAPFIYTIVLRQPMWQVNLAWAKLWHNLRRSDARATGVPPIFGTMHITLSTGFLLGLDWEICSLLFIAYLRKEPMKKDLPLSAASRDPNGTLLNGLKAKRDIVKTFAFWNWQ